MEPPRLTYGLSIWEMFIFSYRGSAVKVESESIDGVLFLVPSGRVDSNSAGDLESAVKDALTDADKIVLDLSSVPYISSAGLRVVLLCAKELKAKNGGFALCGLGENVMDVFQLSGFSNILEIADDRAAAMAAIT